jgi:YD repeat-containing protein
LNRLTSVAYQDGTWISNIYTYLDLSAHKDRLGNWTYYTHDGLQHLTSTTDARGNITQFTWCNCGALTSISNALGNITCLNYNNQELLTNVEFPDNSSMNWQYDLMVGASPTDLTGQAIRSNTPTTTKVSLPPSATPTARCWGFIMTLLGRPLTVTNANNVVVIPTASIS